MHRILSIEPGAPEWVLIAVLRMWSEWRPHTDRVRGEQVVWHRTLHHIVCGVVGSHLVSP